MNHQLANIRKFMSLRSQENIQRGGDGFVSSELLEFDVGLNTKTIHRELWRMVTSGELEHKQSAPRQPHFFRLKS